jgi:hypothetical protein
MTYDIDQGAREAKEARGRKFQANNQAYQMRERC